MLFTFIHVCLLAILLALPYLVQILLRLKSQLVSAASSPGHLPVYRSSNEKR